ncbi:MAG: hypothetical protein CV087_01825 [Candidatus Brocadia sp. WS118]|nr:MAG: hypothetical protein CV087_01825 [Candidatus Brocadia sp. WS118]
MKNTSFLPVSYLIIICSIFSLHAKLTLAYAEPTPILDCLCAVSGRVTDAVSKKGIGNATIGSFEGHLCYTNTSGYYTWDNGIIPCNFGGTYDLTASAAGYLSLTQSIYVEPCIERTLDIELQPITTPAPTVTPWLITEDATNITSSSATLNAIVPLVVGYIFFEYGTASGSYTKSVNATREGTSDKVSANISGLSQATTYYDRIVAVTKPVPTVSTGYTYGNEESFTTLAVTPTPVCEADSVEASPKTLKLERGGSDDVTVTVTGSKGCTAAGEMVTAKIQSGKKRISISPQSMDAGAKGEAVFTITAIKKTGNARVKFETASGLKTTVTVKVRNFKNGGREWRKKGNPELVDIYGFIDNR